MLFQDSIVFSRKLFILVIDVVFFFRVLAEIEEFVFV